MASHGAPGVIRRATFAFALAGGFVLSAEAAVVPGGIDFPAVALGAAEFAVIGLALGAVQSLLVRFPTARRTGFWIAAGVASGLVLALRLGGVAKLGGPHRGMAIAVLVLAPALGALGGSVLALVQPAEEDVLPLLARPALRVALVVVAASLVFATELVDSEVLVLRSYPSAGAALVLATGLLAGEAALVTRETLRRSVPRVAARVGVPLFSAFVVLGTLRASSLDSERASRLLDRAYASRVLAFARDVTDFDRDGSSGWFGGGDCAPLNPHVHPRAAEIPGNGVDDNCRFGDAPPRISRVVEPPAPVAPSPVDIVLVTVDALRADHVGVYGYPRRTTPNIDRLAASGLRFDHAYTSGGSTCFAIPTLLTGLYARRLTWEPAMYTSEARVVTFPWDSALHSGEREASTFSAVRTSTLPPLPYWLKRRGMATYAVVGALIAPILAHPRWLGDAFDRAVVLASTDHDDAVTDAALRLLEANGARPFFLWVHYYEPHDPYDPHPGFESFGHTLVDRYDGDVAFADAELGRLLHAVSARAERPAAVIVAADHGETIANGYSVHGVDLYEDVVRIPLIVSGPGVVPGVTPATVSLVDIVPTVLGWTSTPSPPGLDGVSLLSPTENRLVFTDLWHREGSGRLHTDLTAVTGRKQRVVHDRLNQSFRAFRTGNAERPPRPLAEAPEDTLVAAIGRYLEASGGQTETVP